MRRDSTVDPRKAKTVAKQRYAERQIDKWVKWSWNVRGKVTYNRIKEHQDNYNIKCYGWKRS